MFGRFRCARGEHRNPFLKTPGIDYKTKTCQVNKNHRRQHVHKVAQINKTHSTTPGLRSAPNKTVQNVY